MKWTDAEDIAIALAEKFPTLDPLTVRFTDLRAHVLALDGFDDDPKTSNEPKLEAIQMAWYEEFKDTQQLTMGAGAIFRPGMRAYFIPLGAGIVLVAERVPALGHRRRRARHRRARHRRLSGWSGLARWPRFSRSSA